MKNLTPKKVKILRQILTLRSTFGTPGGSLTWGIDGATSGVIRAGIDGEQLTANVLNTRVEQLKKEGTAAYVFHSIAWPDGEGDTDHVYIQGNTVVIIDSKRWKSKRKYTVTPRGTVMRGTVRFAEGKVSMPKALRSWRRILPGPCRIVGIVCIAQSDVWVQYDTNWHKAPFKLVTLKELNNTLDVVLKNEPSTLSPAAEYATYHMLTHLIEEKPPRKSIFEK